MKLISNKIFTLSIPLVFWGYKVLILLNLVLNLEKEGSVFVLEIIFLF